MKCLKIVEGCTRDCIMKWGCKRGIENIFNLRKNCAFHRKKEKPFAKHGWYLHSTSLQLPAPSSDYRWRGDDRPLNRNSGNALKLRTVDEIDDS